MDTLYHRVQEIKRWELVFNKRRHPHKNEPTSSSSPAFKTILNTDDYYKVFIDRKT